MKKPSPTDPRVKKIMESDSDNFFLDVKFMRQQLNVSEIRFCEILIRCGAPTDVKQLKAWEYNQSVPDWRQRTALCRMWKVMKLKMPEWNARSVEERATLHYTRAASGNASSSPRTASRSSGSPSRMSH